jgi:hypothetical protein
MPSRLLCALCVLLAAAPSPAQPATDRHVALISIDGFADYVLDDPTRLRRTRSGRPVEAYRTAGILDRTPFIVTPDHGFKTVTRVIRPNVLFRQIGLDTSAWAIGAGGTAMVYATRAEDKADAEGSVIEDALTNQTGHRRTPTTIMTRLFRRSDPIR